jgi:MFS family permease
MMALYFLVAAVGPRYEQLADIVPEPDLISGQLAPEDVLTLDELGLSLPFYAALFTGLELVAGLAVFLIGLVVFLKRSDQRFPWILSLGFVTFSLYSSPLTSTLENLLPHIFPLLVLLRTLGLGCFVLSLLVFPDGRFVPSGVRWLAIVWFIYLAVSLVIPDLRFKFSIVWQSFTDLLSLGFVLVFLLSVALVQVNRFRNHADRVQRQQSRWAVYGIGLGMGLMVLVSLPLVFVPIFDLPPAAVLVAKMAAFTVILLAAILFAMAFAAAILYSRLWDIDIIIQRTFSYGLLTSALVSIYFSSVVLLQALFGGLAGQANSPLITVVSTLAIAALFNPLRTRIQDFIDQRFYRRKYDAEQTLSRFAAAARDEVDFEVLTVAILGVVDEAMQPDYVSLWIDRS